LSQRPMAVTIFELFNPPLDRLSFLDVPIELPNWRQLLREQCS